MVLVKSLLLSGTELLVNSKSVYNVRLRADTNNSRSDVVRTIHQLTLKLDYIRKTGLAKEPSWDQVGDTRARNLTER